MRLNIPVLFFFMAGAGCGAQPGEIPSSDSTDSEETETSWVTDSNIDTTSETTTHEDTQTTTGQSTESTDTETATTGTATDTATVTESSSSTASAPDTGSVPDTESGSGTVSDTPPSACEFLSEYDSDLVCCPSELPSSCAGDEWAFSKKPAAFGCCSENLDSHVFCDNNSLEVAECAQGCGYTGPSLECRENSCEQPHVITQYPQTIVSDFEDYTDNFAPSDKSCGPGGGGEDAWFLLRVPPRSLVTANESTATNVTLRRVQGCGATTCLDKAEEPESLAFANDSDAPLTVWLMVFAASVSSSSAEFRVDFSLQPR
ncbi:MAG: hypothetical protein MUC50_06605 [Myxococcota bacterium]|nr:hypothetical protein [Myxococcota bacterium]